MARGKVHAQPSSGLRPMQAKRVRGATGAGDVPWGSRRRDFLPSLAVAAYQACNRISLMGRLLKMSPTRASCGVMKMTPVEYSFLHQLAITSADFQSRPQQMTPNSKVVMGSAQTIHNSFICRPLLIQVQPSPQPNILDPGSRPTPNPKALTLNPP